jgi:hypothetical protein
VAHSACRFPLDPPVKRSGLSPDTAMSYVSMSRVSLIQFLMNKTAGEIATCLLGLKKELKL